MPFWKDYSVVRLQPRVLQALFTALWMLGLAQSLVVSPAWRCTGVNQATNAGSLSTHSLATTSPHGATRAARSTMAMPGGRRRGGGGRGGRGRGRGRDQPPDVFALGGEERLQKFLSHAGLDSRRQCEQMILDGRVRVNGKMVTELGFKVDPKRDQVHVDGDRVFVRPASEVRWVALNKPKGVVCTVSDERGRPTAVGVIPKGKEMRLVPVGRLDRDSCGLLLLTNENSWINPLTHPSYGHEKTYRVSITSGYPTAEQWNTLTRGMLLDGDPNPTRPCIVEVVDYDRRSLVTTVDVIIREGKNRQIRRMFEGIGHKVRSITRISHGPIRLKSLRPGEWRSLEQWEIEKLKNLTTKTLKSPEKVLSAPSRRASESRAGAGDFNAAREAQSRHQQHPRDALDEEEDEWNQTGAWDRIGVKKAVSKARGAGDDRPIFADEDDYEWQTASWARTDDRQSAGGGGRRKRDKGKDRQRANMTEGDRILERLAKGEKMVAPEWEGGGRVERERRPVSRGKGSWTPSGRR